MSTQAQIKANRQNAQKSTGPKTPEGKAASSQNSTKHGLLSHRDIISCESQEEFDLHRDQFLEELAPATPMESFLADRIVSLSWRLKRAEIIHNQAIDALDERNDKSPIAKMTQAMLLKLYPVPDDDSDEPPLDIPLGKMAVKDFTNYRVLDRLLMYERRIENSLHKTMLEFQRLKLINNIETEQQMQAEHPTNNVIPAKAGIHSTNQQRTMNNEQFTNEPNFAKRPDHPTKNTVIPAKAGIQSINQQRTMNNQQFTNEPNTNPFLPSNFSDEDWARLKAFASKEKKTKNTKKHNQTIKI